MVFDYREYIDTRAVSVSNPQRVELIERTLEQLSQIPEMQEVMQRAYALNGNQKIFVYEQDNYGSAAAYSGVGINFNQLYQVMYASSESAEYQELTLPRALVHEMAHLADPLFVEKNREGEQWFTNEEHVRAYHEEFLGPTGTQSSDEILQHISEDFAEHLREAMIPRLTKAYEESYGTAEGRTANELYNKLFNDSPEVVERIAREVMLDGSTITSQEQQAFNERINYIRMRLHSNNAEYPYSPELERNAITFTNDIMQKYYGEERRKEAPENYNDTKLTLGTLRPSLGYESIPLNRHNLRQAERDDYYVCEDAAALASGTHTGDVDVQKFLHTVSLLSDQDRQVFSDVWQETLQHQEQGLDIDESDFVAAQCSQFSQQAEKDSPAR
jgi:hypothetical protein